MLRASCCRRFACSPAALLLLGLVILLQPAQPIRRASHAPLGAPSLAQAAVVAGYGKLPLQFELNQGQTDRRVRFLSRGAGYTLFLTDSEAVLQMLDGECGVRRESRPLPRPSASVPRKPHPCSASVVRMKLTGANPLPKVVPREELPGRSNYFIGNDPSKWRTNVPTYGKVEYRDVYPGVNLVYYGNQRQLEYDFVVVPGADPRQIRLALEGEGNLEVEEGGDLLVRVARQTLRFRKPVIYQEAEGRRREIAGRYVLWGERRIAFDVASYDTSRPLVIDPVLVYSTYLGGTAQDFGYGIAADSAGNVYVTGSTSSTNFPTANALQPTLRGGDVFLAKLNSSGSGLVFSTYLGGTGGDSGQSIAIDSAANTYVTGVTSSNDFPTANPLQAHKGGSQATFVTKLNPTGSLLVYSTYLGGGNYDGGYGIAVDGAGNAYVIGNASSTSFPTLNPLQRNYGGGSLDAFVAKLNAGGSTLAYSTYLGGSGNDGGVGIAVDSAGNAYVTGFTTSPDFPTSGPLQATFGGGICSSAPCSDAFVAKVNAAGSALVYSTYLGGSGMDGGFGIALDSVGNAYVTGSTTSTNFRTSSPLQAVYGGGASLGDAFIAKLNAGGSALVYSTYLGGGGDDGGFGIAVDSTGNAYVTGFTSSTNFPPSNPLQATRRGSADAFVAKLNGAGSALVYSTYLGGSSVDQGNGIAVDLAGNAYVTGTTGSSDFPLASSFQAAFGGESEAFVAKISVVPAVTLSAWSLTFGNQLVGTTSPAQTLTLTNNAFVPLSIASIAVTGTNNADFGIVFNNCGTSLAAGTNCTISVSFGPTAAGTRTASVAIADNALGSPQTVSLTGTGLAPAVTLSAASLTFGNQAVGTISPSQTVKLASSGTAALRITGIAVTGSNAADFAQTSTCGTDVAVGASCVITVTFVPTAVGMRTASVTINDSATGSPHAIILTGTGLTPTPAVTLSVTTLTFGNQGVRTTSAAQTFRLTNAGSATLNITSIAITGTNSADFAQSNTCGPSVAVGANCVITVRFTPTAAGTRTASISITDSASGSPHTITLTGTGIAPVVASGGIVNGASFAPNQAMAAGSIASIFGTNLASSTVVASVAPLPTSLGGTSITVSSAAGSFQASLFFVSPGQINFQFPWELLGQSQVTLTVTFNGAAGDPTTLSMAGAGPGIFSLNSQGSGPGAILIANSADLAQPTGSVPGRSSRPVNRGDFISIFCTGLGPLTTTPPADGALTPTGTLFNISSPATVSIGGITVTPSFAGLAPGFAGLYQVNTQVPANLTPGDSVRLFLTVGGVSSNTVTIAIVSNLTTMGVK